MSVTHTFIRSQKLLPFDESFVKNLFDHRYHHRFIGFTWIIRTMLPIRDNDIGTSVFTDYLEPREDVIHKKWNCKEFVLCL